MSKNISGKDVIRAWKDAEYRESLSVEDRAALPNHPAGLVDLSDAELEMVRGAIEANPRQSFICATGWERCTIRYTFAAPDPRDGCQNSVDTWMCDDLPKL